MNHYVSLSLTNRKSSVHLHALYSPRTALRTFTSRWDKLVICGQYFTIIFPLCTVRTVRNLQIQNIALQIVKIAGTYN
jgi:hypothetical protein